MDYPPDGLEVVVTLSDSSVLLAYWKEGAWWQGVENDPTDIKVETEILSWKVRDN